MLEHIELMFNRLKECHLKIKSKECPFLYQCFVLGHVLSAGVKSANPEKIEKMCDWPTPTNAKEVHSFLGFASYYQRFIPNLPRWPAVYMN